MEILWFEIKSKNIFNFFLIYQDSILIFHFTHFLSQSLHATTNSPLLLPEPFNHLEKSRILNNHWKNICPQRRISETSNERSKRNNLIQPILVLPLFSSVVIAQRFIGKKHSPNLCPPHFPFFSSFFFLSSFFFSCFSSLTLLPLRNRHDERIQRGHKHASQSRSSFRLRIDHVINVHPRHHLFPSIALWPRATMAKGSEGETIRLVGRFSSATASSPWWCLSCTSRNDVPTASLSS